MERDQAVRLTQNLLKKMVENNGSDLFITADFPPAIKIDGTIRPFADRPLTSAQSSLIVRSCHALPMRSRVEADVVKGSEN